MDIQTEDEGLIVYKKEIQYLELVEPKPTKNQRITDLETTVKSLENDIVELKLIVHQLRQPSTDVQEALDKADWERGEVEGVIRFEGKQYKKVYREAREGDVVIIRKRYPGSIVNSNHPYLVDCTFNGKVAHRGDVTTNPCKFVIYDWNRTPETVDVYELIVEDKQDVQRQTVPCAATKTPNQLRAEIIEKAKVFIDENGGDEYSFEIDEDKRTVFAWKIVRKGEGYDAQCHLAECPKDKVFNKHIQSAIAFGKAENIDVSEFEQAVQPTIAVGQYIQCLNTYDKKVVSGYESVEVVDFEHGKFPRFKDRSYATDYKIINDTNAIYSEVSE